MVGTGCDGPFAAKLAVIRAVKTIADEAGVHIGIRKFAVINQVGAVALKAKIDCDEFADVHSSDSHFDKKSFVGLAWRPAGESVCAEVYSTGKTNVPGSRRERHMLRSFARMAPELYRYSSKTEMVDRFAEHIRNVHVASGGGGGSSGAASAGNARAGKAAVGGAGARSRRKRSVAETEMMLWGDDDGGGATSQISAFMFGTTDTADVDDDDLNEIFGE